MRRALAAIAGALAIATPATARAQQPQVTEQVSGVKGTLQAVSAVNDNVVWASGVGGMVLRTVDGGTTWEKHPIPGAEKLQFRGVHALSAESAWALSIGNGIESRIYHTSDGGSTWAEQFRNNDSTAFFDCITFFDAKHGIAYSDASHIGTTIVRTEDGGAHWALLNPADLPVALKGEGGFASSNSCAISVDSKHGWIAAGTPGARIFRTDNAGKSWALVGSVPVVHDSQSGLTAIAFRDAKHGIGVGGHVAGNMNRDSSQAAVATTDDGGVTWTLRHRPDHPGMLSGVALVPKAGDKTAVIASYGGLFFSRDGGDSWTAATTTSYWAVRSAGKRAWAVGTGGRITRLDF
jgi:photosystem II stability/assembly factor-like uncharacterized protein